MAELLLRPANDSIRPLSVIEVELRVRPVLAIAGGRSTLAARSAVPRLGDAALPGGAVLLLPSAPL